MRTIVTLLCSFLLLATLFGLAHPERLSQVAQADARGAVALMQESLCPEGSVDGTCQIVVADQPLPVGLMAVAGPSPFETTPVVPSGRSLVPRTPPPRHVF